MANPGQGHTRRVLLLSSSCLHGCEPFEYAKAEIQDFMGSAVTEILFIPYALADYDKYTQQIRDRFAKVGLDYKVVGIHESSPTEAVKNAQAIFIGGGNTFRLLNSLHHLNLIPLIQKRVLEDGVPYMGSSAGTNVATISIHVTNDMPICHPPTLHALALVPFNINPHYVEPDPNSTHKGETRDDRIFEYLEVNSKHPVLGLKEGAWLRVEGDTARLDGKFGGRLFYGKEKTFVDIPSGTDVSYLLYGMNRRPSM